MSRKTFVPLLACLIALGGWVRPTGAAAQNTGGGPTPPRLAFVDGDVSFWRPGAEEWAPAQVNTAMAAGDEIYVSDGANAELEIGGRGFIRAGSDTELGVDSLENDFLQLRVTSGHAVLDLPRLPHGQTIEVDTPTAAFTVAQPGYYRFDIDDHSTKLTVRRGGAASVSPQGGEPTTVGDGEQLVLEGTDTPQVSKNPAPEPDAWDRWNYDRTQARPEKPVSAQYMPPDVAGADDLDKHGDWRETPNYGHVWVPRDVPPDWAPYSNGRWVYDPYYDWTWVDYAPWGWAPYHYGRWVYAGNYWGWAPGPVVAAPVYSPALVAFFGGGGGGVSVSVGLPLPFVSWVALGWGEPVTPWWGGGGFYGRPYWGGWGGPRVVNNVVVNNTKIVNNITKYQNANVNNAVVGTRRDGFGRGGQRVRISPEQARQLRPIRGAPGVRPAPQSLVAREGRGRRPPDKIRNRPVVATRQPQDPRPRLAKAGIQPRGEPRLQTKIVRPGPRQNAGGRPAGQVAGRGATPPPPPRAAGARPGGEEPLTPRQRREQQQAAPGGERPRGNAGREAGAPTAGNHPQRAERGTPPPPPRGQGARAQHGKPESPSARPAPRQAERQRQAERRPEPQARSRSYRGGDNVYYPARRPAPGERANQPAREPGRGGGDRPQARNSGVGYPAPQHSRPVERAAPPRQAPRQARPGEGAPRRAAPHAAPNGGHPDGGHQGGEHKRKQQQG